MNQTGNPATTPTVPPPPPADGVPNMTAVWTVTVKSADHQRLLTFQYQQDDLQTLPPFGLIFRGPEWKNAQGHVNPLMLQVTQLVQLWGAPVTMITLLAMGPIATMGPTDGIPFIHPHYEPQFIAALAAMGFTKTREVPLAAG